MYNTNLSRRSITLKFDLNNLEEPFDGVENNLAAAFEYFIYIQFWFLEKN